jgi:hypothetical protein
MVAVVTTAAPLPRDHRTYLAAIERRWVRRLRPVARIALRAEPLPPPERAEAFARSYFDGDPLADAFVADLPALGGFGRGRALLERVLAGGIGAVPDAPPSLVALFRQVDAVPAWLDRDRLELGARVYRRLGVAALSIDVGGQMLGYTDNVGVQPVLLSGSYSRSMRSRLLDTTRYHLAASDPGGLEVRYPAPEGLAITLRVRLLHAYIRSRVAASDVWDAEQWGVPISQLEMMGPMLGQSIGTAQAAVLAGHLTTRREREALLHFWRYNGYLMGCDPAWFPDTFEEAVQLTSFYFLRRSFDALPECARLVRAVPGAFAPRPGTRAQVLRDRLNQQAQIGWLALAFGPTYRWFDMPNPAPGLALNALAFPWHAVLSVLAWAHPGGSELVDRYQRRRRRRWYATETRSSAKEAEYVPGG